MNQFIVEVNQITIPSWWDKMAACDPIINNAASVKARAESRASYVNETLATLKRIGKPYLFANLRDYLGLSKSRMSSIVEELAAQGLVAKVYRGDKLYVTIADANGKYEPPPKKEARPSKNDQAAERSQRLILEAVRAGCDRLEDLPKATSLSLATCKKHWLKFKADGVLKSVPIPNTNNHIRIVPC